MGYVDLERREAGAFSVLAGNPLAVSVALAALAVAAASVAGGAYDGDLWWILATGREVAESGIPYENPFSVDSGQGVVVQQWLHDVACWAAYSAFGMPGVAVLVLALSCAVAAAMSLVAVEYGGYAGRCKAVPLLTAFVAFCLASVYVGSRPQAWTMLACCAVLVLSRRFALTGDAANLVPLPFVALLHSNLHASMLALDAFAFVVVVAPAAWSHRGDDGFPRTWVAAPMLALAASLAASCVNPYGARAPLYLLESLGAASYGDMIQEMGRVELTSAWGVAAGVMAAVAAGLALARRQLKPYSALELSCAVLMCAGLAAFFMAVRNVWVFAVLWLPFTVQMLSALDLVPSSERAARVMSAPVAVIAVLVGGLLAAGGAVVGDVAAYPATVEESADDSIPAAEAAYLSDMRDAAYGDAVMPLWNGFDIGGYLEFEGFEVSLDQRPELWEDAIAGGGRRDHRDYVDFRKGDEAAGARSLEGRDVALVGGGEDPVCDYLRADSEWSEVSIDGSSDGWSVFVRKGTPAAGYAGAAEQEGE